MKESLSKKYQKAFLVLGVLLIFLAGLGIGYFLPHGKAVDNAPPVTREEAAHPATAPYRFFGDGAGAGVVIDGFSAAQPQSGLDQMPLVFEFPVEAAIPRYFGIVVAQGEQEGKGDRPLVVGPIRSLRPYVLDVADGFSATVAHVGGSPAALDQVRKNKITTVNQYFQSQYFYRRSDRRAPHNVYTKTELLLRAQADGALSVLKNPSWQFLPSDAQELGARDAVTHITVSHFDPSYVVQWIYQPDSREYLRQQGGKNHVMEDGATIAAENVVVLRTDIKILDAVGRRNIRTTGDGDAQLYRHGGMWEGTWRREEGKPFEFFGLEGNPWQFAQGKVWVHVVEYKQDVKSN